MVGPMVPITDGTMLGCGADLDIPDDPRKPPRRRDVNAAHFRAFKTCMDKGFEQFFGAIGDDQIHLWLLCTHPSFRRRGAGSRLCKWGLVCPSPQARDVGAHAVKLRRLALFKAPMGYPNPYWALFVRLPKLEILVLMLPRGLDAACP